MYLIALIVFSALEFVWKQPDYSDDSYSYITLVSHEPLEFSLSMVYAF